MSAKIERRGGAMLKSNLIKILMLVMIAVTMLGNNVVHADHTLPDYIQMEDDGTEDDGSSELDYWKPSGLGDEQTLVAKVGPILALINMIGVISSVVCLMILGIKYMLGSVEEKADYKSAMIPYLIGAILVFSITTLPNLIYNITQSM